MHRTHLTTAPRGTTLIAIAALVLAVAGGFAARAEDRLRLRLGTAVAKEAQPKPPRTPRPPELRGSIAVASADSITIDTPANLIKKQWVVPTEDVLEVLLDGEPEELRSGRGMVAAGNGAAALEQLAPTDGPDADGLWDQASAAVRAERMFVKAAATALMAIRSGEGLDAALAGLRDFLRKHSGSHHAAAVQELMGDVLVRSGKPAEAAAAYAAIATQAPARRIRAATLTGRVQLDQQRWGDARAALEKAIAVETPPGDFSAALERREARLLLARCLARDGRATEAIALARQVLAEADPSDGEGLAEIFVVLGEAQRSAGDKNKDALISYLTVDMVHNGVPEAHAEALAGLVELWEKENHPARARDARQALEQTYPDSLWLRRVAPPPGS
jgi:tetratricopeptide (TPR) repeat protein